jgi:hypothetical protein
MSTATISNCPECLINSMAAEFYYTLSTPAV